MYLYKTVDNNIQKKNQKSRFYTRHVSIVLHITILVYNNDL